MCMLPLTEIPAQRPRRPSDRRRCGRVPRARGSPLLPQRSADRGFAELDRPLQRVEPLVDPRELVPRRHVELVQELRDLRRRCVVRYGACGSAAGGACGVRRAACGVRQGRVSLGCGPPGGARLGTGANVPAGRSAAPPPRARGSASRAGCSRCCCSTSLLARRAVHRGTAAGEAAGILLGGLSHYPRGCRVFAGLWGTDPSRSSLSSFSPSPWGPLLPLPARKFSPCFRDWRPPRHGESPPIGDSKRPIFAFPVTTLSRLLSMGTAPPAPVGNTITITMPTDRVPAAAPARRALELRRTAGAQGALVRGIPPRVGLLWGR